MTNKKVVKIKLTKEERNGLDKESFRSFAEIQNIIVNGGNRTGIVCFDLNRVKNKNDKQ
jgi:hypothetical protein